MTIFQHYNQPLFMIKMIQAITLTVMSICSV